MNKGIINKKMVTAETEQIQQQLNYTKYAIECLRKYFTINSMEDILKYCPLTFLHKFLVASETEYIGKLFVPAAERDRIHNQYKEIEAELTTSCNAIEAILHMPFKVEFDGTQLALDAKEVKSYLEKKYYRELSDEDIEYFNVLSKVMSTLDEASKWEKEHNYLNYTAKGDAISPTDFNVFTMWQRKEFSEESFRNMIGVQLGKIQQRPEEDE